MWEKVPRPYWQKPEVREAERIDGFLAVGDSKEGLQYASNKVEGKSNFGSHHTEKLEALYKDT